MNAENFVMELEKIPQSIEQLQKQEVSKNYIKTLLESYKVKKRSKNIHSDNPIIELIENYDATNVQIGMIGFDERIEQNEEYMFFGKFEVDDLAIKKSLGTVVLLENGLDYVVYQCASSGSNFLDAIIVAAGYLEKRAVDDNLYENQELTCKIAEECAEIAGSKSTYQEFYKMLFGCDF